MACDREQLYSEIGQLIRAARVRRGLTQEKLASTVSLKRTSITNIEKGRQGPPLHTLLDIAAALGVEPGALLPASEPAPRQDLAQLLKDRPKDEREWIETSLSSRKGG